MTEISIQINYKETESKKIDVERIFENVMHSFGPGVVKNIYINTTKENSNSLTRMSATQGRVFDKLSLPLKTTVCTNLVHALQFDNKHQDMQQVALSVGSMLFVWLNFARNNIIIQQYQINAESLSKPLSIYKAEKIISMTAQSKENNLFVACAVQDSKGNDFQIDWLHIDFETRKLYKETLTKSNSSTFFMGAYKANEFAIVIQSEQKWRQYSIAKYTYEKEEFLVETSVDLPGIRQPKSFLFYDPHKVLFCECIDNIWSLKSLNYEKVNIIVQDKTGIPCNSKVFLSEVNDKFIWAIASDVGNVTVFKITHRFNVQSKSIFSNLSNIQSITLNSKDQVEIINVENQQVKFYTEEGKTLFVLKTEASLAEGHNAFPITIFPNTLNDFSWDKSLSDYQISSCNGTMISTNYPIQAMVASEIAQQLYPKLFPLHKILPSGQLCIMDKGYNFGINTKCSDGKNIHSIEEIYAVSVLLGITLQQSSYSCWEDHQEITSKIDSLSMAFTWVANKELSTPGNSVTTYSEKTFKYQQLPCGKFTGTECNAEKLIEAYRNVTKLNDAVINEIIDTSVCITQAYDCSSTSIHECNFHRSYDTTSQDIRKIIGMNKEIIEQVIQEWGS